MNNLTLFYTGQIASGFAFELFKSAIAFHILNVTGSPLQFSLAFIFDNLPKLFFLQLAGYIVDKFDKKLVFVIIDVIEALYLIFIFYYLSTHDASVFTLLVFTFINGFIKAFTYPSTKAIIPFLAKDKNRMKASSFEISNDKIARTLAPTIAILFFAKFGIEISILLTALCYVLSAGTKMFLKLEDDEIDTAAKKTTTLLEGFQSLFKSKAVVLAWINAAISQFIFNPFLGQVFPNLLKKNSEGVVLNSFFKYIFHLLGSDTEDVYLSLTAFLNFASTIGVLASLAFFQLYGDKVNWKRGIKISTLALVPSSILVSLVVVFLGEFGHGNAVLLTYILIPLNLFFYFIINTYNVFFTFYYQEEIGRKSIGKFVANLMTIYMGVKFLGNLMYGIMLEKGFIMPVIVLLIATAAKVVAYYLFAKEDAKA